MEEKLSVPPQFSYQQFQEYVRYCRHFQTDIKEITVSKEVLDWYEEFRKQVAKNLNIATTKNYSEPMYDGLKLVTK